MTPSDTVNYFMICILGRETVNRFIIKTYKPLFVQPTHLYYASSTYHHVLAIARAGNHPEKKSSLLSSPSFDATTFIRALNNWKESPFEKIYRVPSDTKYTRPKIWKVQTSDRLFGKKIINKVQPAETIVGRDNDVLSQALLHYSPKSSNGICLEDGTAAYGSSTHSSAPLWKQILRKPLYGHWYSPPQVLGKSKWINKFVATYPELVRPELSHLPVEQISPDFLQQMSTDWLREYIDKFGIDADTLEKVETLIILPHPDAVSNQSSESEMIRRQITKYSQAGAMVGIKYHPRDAKKGLISTGGKNTVEIPQSIPAELVYILSDSINLLIGTTSTALLTGCWFDSNTEIKSLARALGYNQERTIEVLDEIGVDILPD